MSRAPLFQSQLPHYEAKSITLPKFDLPDVDEFDLKAKTAHFLECRVIREGQDRWEEITRAGSFENWKRIGAALSIGKNRSLFVSRANRAIGRTYSLEFNRWLVQYRFDGMAKSLRSVAIELHENIHAIEQWRTTLTDKQRRRLRGPLQNVRRWKREPESVRHVVRREVTVKSCSWVLQSGTSSGSGAANRLCK